MMESVVLDNVVFEDVIAPPDSSEQNVNSEEASPTQSSSKPINIRADNNDVATTSPAVTYHTESYSSSPSSSYTPSAYPTEATSFSNQYGSPDAGAFAPEYHRESSSYQSDSAFRETTFSAEIPTVTQPEAVPIDVAVIDPEKLGDGMNSYITYKIKTTASYPKFKDSSLVVRRYNDFLWFHEQLRSNNKGVLIPPLPEKALINRFSSEFIEIRRKELEKFLNRVIQHPVLHKRPEVVLFLESNDEQFTAIKSKTTKPQPATEQPPPQQSSGGGFGSFVSFLGHGIAAATSFTANAKSFLARYKNSLFNAIMDVYPTIGISNHLQRNPKNFFMAKENRKQLFDNLSVKLKFDPLERRNWYPIGTFRISQEKGGATVMSYYQHSLRDALNDIYDFDYPNPEELQEYKSVRYFFDSLAKKHSFDSLIPQNWYSFFQNHRPNVRDHLSDKFSFSLAITFKNIYPSLSFDPNLLKEKRRHFS